MHKYVGRDVEIIYLDRSNNITQRRIQIRSVRAGVIEAYCYDRQAPRVFRIENILAVQLIKQANAG